MEGSQEKIILICSEMIEKNNTRISGYSICEITEEEADKICQDKTSGYYAWCKMNENGEFYDIHRFE